MGNSGQFSTSPPATNGNISRIVGHIVFEGPSKIYFNPSSDWIEIEA